ncbi:MAG: ABC transporter permease [Eubacteriales bacterium]
MLTIIKITLNNIKQKKFRTFLIILSIALSTALLYSTLAISTTSIDFFERSLKQTTGNIELVVTTNNNSQEQFFESDLNNGNYFDYSYGYINLYGTLVAKDSETLDIRFRSMQLESFTDIFKPKLTEQADDNFSGKKIIINNKTAENLELSINDTIDIMINGKTETFTIWSIIDSSTNFLTNDQFINVLLPLEEGQNLVGIEDKVSGYYIKTSTNISIDKGIDFIENEYSNLTAEKVFDEDAINNMLNMIVLPLLFMVLAVCLVSCFIIYSSFKVIVIERFPLIGTLRSIGATNRNTRKALYIEGFTYSFLGGIIGNCLGIGILTIIINMLLTISGGNAASITNIHLKYHLIAFVFSIALTFISSLIPIIRTSKLSIKDIIFSKLNNEKHLSIKRIITGFIFIFATYLLFITAPKDLRLIMYGLGFMLFLIGTTFLIPLISYLLTSLLVLIFKPFFGNEADIAISNIRHDKRVMNNIILLGIGLGVIFMVNILSSSISKGVIYAYDNATYDAMMYSQKMNEDYISKVIDTEGVEKVIPSYETNNINITNKDFEISSLIGMSGKTYCANTWNEFTDDFTDEIQQQFESERSIIVTKFQARKNDINIGDILTIELKNGNKDYKVIAIVDSLYNNSTPYYIHEDFYKEDIEANPSMLYLHLNKQIDEVKTKLKGLSPTNYTYFMSIQEVKEQNQTSNDTMFILIKSFSIIAMIIGIVGIFNNYMVSFMSRKKTVAVFRSLGLSKKQMRKLFLLETLFCGIVGSITAILLGVILTKLLFTKLLFALGLPEFTHYYNFGEFLFLFISGITISLISSLIPSIKTTKSSIINELRYE